MATKFEQSKKNNFSLMAGPLPLPPLNGPAIKKITFFPNHIHMYMPRALFYFYHNKSFLLSLRFEYLRLSLKSDIIHWG